MRRIAQIGEGSPLIVLHGGPEFDHSYLRPGMDMLADSFHLIYYDQRGPGRSSGECENISVESEIADLENIREHLQLEQINLLGHSWGAILAMEYAMRYPESVSHLIIMNSAPATHEDFLATIRLRASRLAKHEQTLNTIRASEQFKAGDPKTVSEYYYLLFTAGVARTGHLNQLNFHFENFTREGILFR